VRTNFPLDKYGDLLGCIDRMSMEELVMAVRRQSQGFSRGTSTYRGVTHHPSGRWEARIGVPGSKNIYLGLFVEVGVGGCAAERRGRVCECMRKGVLEGSGPSPQAQPPAPWVSHGGPAFCALVPRCLFLCLNRKPPPSSQPVTPLVPLATAQEVDAARAYDRCLVRLRGTSAATNFALGEYRSELGDYHQWQQRLVREDPRWALEWGWGEGGDGLSRTCACD
jgi:hypothetical protein